MKRSDKHKLFRNKKEPAKRGVTGKKREIEVMNEDYEGGALV